jgi:hypothetical protein
MYIPVTKSGRVASDTPGDRGVVIHLVETDYRPRGEFEYIHEGWKPALCGSRPGSKRGNGWTNEGFDPAIATCLKCKKKLEKHEARV